jgi:nicotinamidase-related amidase
MAPVWDDVLTERDRAVYREAGYGTRGGGGKKPALLVIDVTYDFVGDKPEPILESIKKFPNSCGEEGWKGMEAIKELLDTARELDVPVFYTKGMDERLPIVRGSWTWKNAKAIDKGELAERIGNEIPDMIAPREGEVVIKKTKPSAFYGTPLTSYLVGLGVDTVVVTGTTTSGCIRASVIDAFSDNFRVLIVEEGVFDRGQVSHKINLFDMQSKYADVIPLQEAKNYLRSLKPIEVPAR